jgi:hypothetical protein
MNIKQLIVLITAVVLFTMSELFPPWSYKDGMTSAKTSAGYHFIYNPPDVKSPGEMKEIFSLPDNDYLHHFTVRRDLARLYGQRMILLFLMIGLLLIFDKRKTSSKKTFAVVSICIGVAFLAIYVWYVSETIWY